MNKDEFIKDFESNFYNIAYYKWRIKKEKSGKDIIGQCYEEHRKNFYLKSGLKISKKNKKVLGSDFNADLVIENKYGNIIIVEEEKGHYVDSCFLKRAIGNCAELAFSCIENKVETPFFVLSCPTKMNNFESVFNKYIRIYNPDIQKIIIDKFFYIPLCKNGRINKKLYFTKEKNCFTLNDDLVNYQISFLNKLIDEK